MQGGHDALVLLSVLVDLARDKDFNRKDYVRIFDETPGNAWPELRLSESITLKHDSINSYFEIYINEIHEHDLMSDLLRRNLGEPVSLASFKYEGSSFRLGKTRKPEELSQAIPEGPDANAWIRAWLLGYSTDGQRALVYFQCGPSPHGAVGAYLLEKRTDGRWMVKQRYIAHFV
jgi:hypothetical protein